MVELPVQTSVSWSRGRLPKWRVNMQTLAFDLMKHLDPLARPAIHTPSGKKLRKTVAKAEGTVIYINQDIEYRALTPLPVRLEDEETFRVLIVRGPTPLHRATARVVLRTGDEGRSAVAKVTLPAPDDWLETDCGPVIYVYERELAAYDAAATAAYFAAVASRGRHTLAPNDQLPPPPERT